MNYFIIHDEHGVAIGFRSELDRERYLMDPMTGSEWRKVDRFEAYEFVYSNGYRWGMPTSFYDGSLDGLEVMFSEPAA